MRRKTKIILSSLAVLVCVLAGFLINRYNFTQNKWNGDKEHRYRIVSSLLFKYDIEGMSESEVIKLLGEEEGKECTTFKNGTPKYYYSPESTLVYYLGCSYIDTEWLIIPIENGIASDAVIGLT